MTAETAECNVTRIGIDMEDGRTVDFQVDTKAEGPACFALGIRKSGSSIFYSITGALAEFNQVNVIDIPGAMFEHGYRYREWNQGERLHDLIWRGNAYIGFRDAPTALFKDPIFSEAKKILLVRDPRDALVSEYFSNAYSHSLPSENTKNSVIAQEREKALKTSVEDYALSRVKFLNRTVSGYGPLIGSSGLLILRYEDVILNKANWIERIAEHFQWEISDQLVQNILGWADVRPETEDPKAFIRRVEPGDHLDKLSPGVIEQVNDGLATIWQDFGYDLEG